MKTIGLIGGLTWLSTIDYYRMLNQMINQELGGAEAGKIIVYSLNFGEIKVLTETDRWDLICNLVVDAAKKLEQAGADCLLVGANTMHKLANEIQDAIKIPLIHIATPTAEAIAERQLKKVALLGTKFTMQLDFFTKKLSQHSIAAIIPSEEDVEYINTAIYEEMGKGKFIPETKSRFLTIMQRLVIQGAEGIILGCTELPILINPEDCTAPLFNTTELHTRAAVRFALS
jgi:aspartate racemase